MTDQRIINKIIDDLVENRNVYKEMKEDISLLVSNYDDGKEANWTYDEFYTMCLNYIKKIDIQFNSTISKSMKDYFFNSMLQIVIDELKNRGRIEESKEIQQYLN